jgi:acetyltransferase-like isoleucine patch superfamily enzyme
MLASRTNSFQEMQYTIIETADENIADDVYIGNYVHVRPDVRIATGCSIRDYVFLAEGCSLDENVSVFQYSNIAGWTVIERDVFVGPRVTITNGNNLGGQIDPVCIQQGAIIWSGAIVLPGVTIGAGCVIAAGAVVTKNTEPGMFYVGVPALKRGSV